MAHSRAGICLTRGWKRRGAFYRIRYQDGECRWVSAEQMTKLFHKLRKNGEWLWPEDREILIAILIQACRIGFVVEKLPADVHAEVIVSEQMREESRKRIDEMEMF